MSTTPRPVTREIGYTRIGQSGNLWWPFFQDDEETPETTPAPPSGRQAG